jgi:HNH endonuclease
MSVAAEKRFFDKIRIDGDCWVWTAGKIAGGYGKFYSERRTVLPHRWAWQFFFGDLPEDLALDHLCRRRDCVNPWHLEPVTIQVNSKRGANGYALREKCRAGLHDITDPTNWSTAGRKTPRCRLCANERAAEFRARKRAGSL